MKDRFLVFFSCILMLAGCATHSRTSAPIPSSSDVFIPGSVQVHLTQSDTTTDIYGSMNKSLTVDQSLSLTERVSVPEHSDGIVYEETALSVYIDGKLAVSLVSTGPHLRGETKRRVVDTFAISFSESDAGKPATAEISIDIYLFVRENNTSRKVTLWRGAAMSPVEILH